MLRPTLLLFAFFAVAHVGIAQNPPNAGPKPTARSIANAESDELAALKTDLQGMRTTLYQMQTNLAFVSNTTTPLYHEFELDIRMWQTMLDQMQLRVDRLEKVKEPGKNQ